MGLQMRVEIIPDDCVTHRRVVVEQQRDDLTIEAMMGLVFSAVIAHGFSESTMNDYLKEYVDDLPCEASNDD